MFLALNPDDHLWASPKQKLEEHKVGDIEQVCEEEEEDSTATFEPLVNLRPKRVKTKKNTIAFLFIGVFSFFFKHVIVCTVFLKDQRFPQLHCKHSNICQYKEKNDKAF